MKNFTRVPNALITDARLSLGARMVYIYIASKPGTWKFSPPIMAHEMGIGEDWLKTLLRELEALHLLKRERLRGADGRWGASSYTLTKVVNTNVGKTNVGATNVGKTTPLVRLNNSKTEISNTKREKGDKSPALSRENFKDKVREAIAELKAEGMKMDRDVNIKFYDYWTQETKEGKQLWETMRAFNVKTRLKKWIKDERNKS